jgi:hypothetical protein
MLSKKIVFLYLNNVTDHPGAYAPKTQSADSSSCFTKGAQHSYKNSLFLLKSLGA